MATSATQIRSAAVPLRWTPEATESDPFSVEANLRGQDRSLLAPYTTSSAKRIVYSYSDILDLPGTTVVGDEVRVVTSLMLLGTITLPGPQRLVPFADGLVIDGLDWRFSSLVGSPGTGNGVIDITDGVSGISIKNLTVSSPSSGDAVRFDEGGANSELHDVRLVAAGETGSGIYIASASGISIRDAYIEAAAGNTGTGAAVLDATSSSIRMTNVQFSGDDALLNIAGDLHEIQICRFVAQNNQPAIVAASALVVSTIANSEFALVDFSASASYRYVDWSGVAPTWQDVGFFGNTFRAPGNTAAAAVRCLPVAGTTHFSNNTLDCNGFDYTASVGGALTGLVLRGNTCDGVLLTIGDGLTLSEAQIDGANRSSGHLLSIAGDVLASVSGNTSTGGDILHMVTDGTFAGQCTGNTAPTGFAVNGSGNSFIGSLSPYGASFSLNRCFVIFNLSNTDTTSNLSIVGNTSQGPTATGTKTFINGSTTSAYGASVARGNWGGSVTPDFG